MKKYLSEFNEENLSIEWEWESGGRTWVTYDSVEEFKEALKNCDFKKEERIYVVVYINPIAWSQTYFVLDDGVSLNEHLKEYALSAYDFPEEEILRDFRYLQITEGMFEINDVVDLCFAHEDYEVDLYNALLTKFKPLQ